MSSVFFKGMWPASICRLDGRLIHYTYGSSGGGADNLNRLDAIKDDDSGSPGDVLASLTYLGLAQVAVLDYEESDVKLDLFGGTSGTYAGLERFGRVVDQQWRDYGASADRDRVKCGRAPSGSTVVLGGSSGSLASSSHDNESRFTRPRWDTETGLYYYRARYYHSQLGRFGSRDLTRYGWVRNLYAYARNDPTRSTDPTGLWPCAHQCPRVGDKRNVEFTGFSALRVTRGVSNQTSDAMIDALHAMLTAVHIMGILETAGLSVASDAEAIAKGIETIIHKGQTQGLEDAISECFGRFERQLAATEGVRIWVGFTYELCDLENCLGLSGWCKRRNWQKKTPMRPCSAEGQNSPAGIGFRSDDVVGMARALPGCIREIKDALRL